MILKAFESYNISIKFFNNNCATKTQNFHNQPQNSQHRNITKCYNKSITQRDKLLIQRRRNHMSITEKQRQQQAELHK
ncbi:hypothetical protein CA803_13990, partial [Staphylococcus aureus]|uniref:hypothetical protein n=1 Tax=Staphylococcus aureus TaxID=1280 RepID=UPI000B9CD23E